MQLIQKRSVMCDQKQSTLVTILCDLRDLRILEDLLKSTKPFEAEGNFPIIPSFYYIRSLKKYIMCQLISKTVLSKTHTSCFADKQLEGDRPAVGQLGSACLDFTAMTGVQQTIHKMNRNSPEIC